MDKMKRRDALKAIGVSVLASSLLFHRCSSEKTNRLVSKINLDLVDGMELWERERFDELNAYTFFNQHEIETITDLVDLIIPEDEYSPNASQVEVPAFIEFIVKDIPTLQDPMRNGLQWLDSHARYLYKEVFVSISPDAKISILDSVAYPEKASPELSQGVEFFSLIRELTTSGYFTTQEGVEYLGYVGNRPNVWEGVPADVLRQYGLSI